VDPAVASCWKKTSISSLHLDHAICYDMGWDFREFSPTSSGGLSPGFGWWTHD
jgi:hypothetical protein